MEGNAREKRSAHLVDPDVKAYTDTLQEVALNDETLPVIREEHRAMARTVEVPADLPVEIAERHIPGPADAPDVRVLVFTPREAPAPRPAYLHIHGGGMVLGLADGSNLTNAALAVDLGCTVVSVDYRLAPETPHPGPIEDCYAALKWLHSQADELGIDTKRIAIGGESAGGGLAASLAILARDRAEIPVIFQRLWAPMLDDRTSVNAPHPYTGEYLWNREQNHYGWRALLGHEPGQEGVSPYAAAARATDLSGLPPAFISVGALDLFLDESMDYAKRLIRAGVPTELHVYPGYHHGSTGVPEARSVQAEVQARHEALRRAFYG